MGTVLLRDGLETDLAAATALYRHHVVNGSASFETEPPDEAEMGRRRADVRARGLPWLVAESDGRCLGYAYAGPFRLRPAYRFTVENSIYIAPEAIGQGLGRLLLAELIARCERAGARQMLAVIGDSANQASVGLHRALGFSHVGVLQAVGRKFDAWRDVVLMQRALGTGASRPANT